MSQYDERLLADAPAASRLEKQEGYNVDLLGAPRNASGKTSPPPVPPTAPLASNVDHAENGIRKEEAYARYEDTPWYKTKKGIIALIIIAVIIVAAVVGGAVGGTVHKSNKSAATTGDGSTTGNGGQGQPDAPAAAPASGSSSPAASGSQAAASSSTGATPSAGPNAAGGNNGGAGTGGIGLPTPSKTFVAVAVPTV